LAPEVWTHSKYSKSSDIWALGVILFQLACKSSHPFPAEDIDELKSKVLNEDIYMEDNDRDSKFLPFFSKMLNKDES
jgi:serine/threonine protein kinase